MPITISRRNLRFNIQLIVALSLSFAWFSCGPAPEASPTSFSLLSGDNQTGPARGLLNKDVAVTFNETTVFQDGDTGQILIEYKIIKGNGSVSKLNETIHLPEVIGDRVRWTLGDFGKQEMEITAKWVTSQKSVNGSPILVKANTEVVKDADNNTYNVVQIGDQVWIGANLKTTKYNDGSNITLLSDEVEWANTSVKETPAYCWYKNDMSYANPYGALYNYYAATSSKLCPTGWHVPTDAEFQALVTYAGGEAIAAKKLKEVGQVHWFDGSEGTNDFLFTAVGGGSRTNRINGGGAWGNPPGTEELWHTSTSLGQNNCISYFIPYGSDSLKREGSMSDKHNLKEFGSSIRCIRD